MRRIATLVLVVGLSAPLSACGSSSPSSPKAVRASKVAAGLAQKSVHFHVYVEVDMQGSSTLTADVTADSGVARLDDTDGIVEMRLVNDAIYLKGDAAALYYDTDITLRYANVRYAQLRHYAGKWISMPMQAQSVKWTAANLGGGDNVYSQMSDGLTLASILNGVPPQLELEMVNGLPGRVLGSFQNQGDRYSVDARFSKWNEPVHVQAPAHAIPIATARGC